MYIHQELCIRGGINFKALLHSYTKMGTVVTPLSSCNRQSTVYGTMREDGDRRDTVGQLIAREESW